MSLSTLWEQWCRWMRRQKIWLHVSCESHAELLSMWIRLYYKPQKHHNVCPQVLHSKNIRLWCFKMWQMCKYSCKSILLWLLKFTSLSNETHTSWINKCCDALMNHHFKQTSLQANRLKMLYTVQINACLPQFLTK